MELEARQDAKVAEELADGHAAHLDRVHKVRAVDAHRRRAAREDGTTDDEVDLALVPPGSDARVAPRGHGDGRVVEGRHDTL